MEKINDGGPAFPALRETENPAIPLVMASGGMSLRAWFAGQALAGMSSVLNPDSYSMVARIAVAYADALIAELEQPRG